MKKCPPATGFFRPRFILAFSLCSVGALLAALSIAAPNPPGKTGGQARSDFKPVVTPSLYNGVSPALRDLPATVPNERDESEHDLLRLKPNRPVPDNYVDAALQPPLAAMTMPAPLQTFEGMNQSEGCGGCIPPDTNGAVGPTQYVQMVNSAMSVYDKSGTRLLGPIAINALWSGLPGACKDNNNGDPVVIYDQLADRWMVSQFAVPTGNYHECIAISKTADAAGAYYVYDFPLSTTKFEDYPHFGLWPDAYYMSTHEFNVAGTAYLGAGAFAFERTKMLAGLPAQMVYFSLGNGNTSFGGHLPSDLDGFTLPPAGAPNYFAEVDTGTEMPPNAALRLWKFHVDWTTPANSTFGVSGQPNSTTTVTDFARPDCSLAGTRAYVIGCVPQAGDPSQLDPIGDRLMFRLAYRNFGDHESLVLNHMAVVNSTTGQMGPRWYEVRNPGGTPQIFQQSTFGAISQTDLLYRFVGSIAMDNAGDMAIAYSTSSSLDFPSIAYAGRLAADPLNSLAQGEAQMFAGTGPQRGELFAPQTGRWGDYSALTVDPVDDCTFWFTTEYFEATDAPTGAWHTRVGSFKFPQCTPRPVGTLRGTITDSVSGNPIAGASVTAGGYTATTNGSGYYQFSPLAPGAYTATASAIGYFTSSPAAVTVTNGGATTQDFALVRNPSQPTPTPAPLPTPLPNVNPPVLNDPGTTITTSNYTVSWTPAEVATGLSSYVVEESTNYVNPLFDNADGTTPPGQAGSLWATTPSTDPWTPNPAYRNSVPNSYYGDAGGGLLNPSLTLINAITVPTTVSSARLNFYSRYFNDPDDTGNVEISTNGGSTWSLLKVLTDAPTTPPADVRVQSQEIDLTSYRGIPFKLRYRFNNGTLFYFLIRSVGWWVDDVSVDGATWTQVGTTPPGTTSLNLTNKPNGHYYYRVRATYGSGSPTTNSNVQDIIVNAPAPTLLGIASRKTHGAAGTFDIPLPGIECRNGGANGDFDVVFTYSGPPSVGIGTCCGNPATSSISGNEATVHCTGVTNTQSCSVAFATNSAVMSALLGDTNADGSVNSADIGQTKSQSGNLVGGSNFREDVTVDGNINSADISLVKSKSGTALP